MSVFLVGPRERKSSTIGDFLIVIHFSWNVFSRWSPRCGIERATDDLSCTARIYNWAQTLCIKCYIRFPREGCNVWKYFLNVASTRKPLAREGVVVVINFAMQSPGCDSQSRREGDELGPRILPPVSLSVFASCICLRDRGRPRHFGQPKSLSSFHTSCILSFSRYFQIPRENLYQVLPSFTFCMSSIQRSLLSENANVKVLERNER